MSEEKTPPPSKPGRARFSPASMPKRQSSGTPVPTPPPGPSPSPGTVGARWPGPGRRADGDHPPTTERRHHDPESTQRAIMPVPSTGHLGGHLQVEWGTDTHKHPTLIGEGATGDANSLIVLRRTAFVPEGPAKVELPRQAGHALLRWAQEHALGQVGVNVSHAARRRERALAQLRAQGLHVARVLLEPQWRIAVGLGEKGNAHELGISLHGTYGWPIIPGSGLKGVTAAFMWGRAGGTAKGREMFREAFGAPFPPSRPIADEEGTSADARSRENEMRARGSVRFLDALPHGGPVTVEVDVLTPHVKPYYDTTREHRDGETPQPPAEYHQPVPVQFLTITGGAFAADLVGDSERITGFAADWLRRAVDDLGVGAKTSAGYGYMDVRKEQM